MRPELVSRPYVERFVDWAADKPEVVVLSADLTNSCEIGRWRDTYPERFFSMGMAEQNMLSFAAGLAREGLRPFVHTFAVFLYRRPYDQLAMSIAYPNLPVRLMGFLPGITTPGGVTHQAIEDLAILRATPNMTILETGDATEVESVLDAADAVDGPVYVRLLRGEIPRLFPADEPLRLGQSRQLSRGRDLALITSGIATEEGIRAGRVLAEHGVGVSHLHVSTLKPFGDPALERAIGEAKNGVITLENHSIIGGLGAAVAEYMAEQAVGVPLRRLGLRDRYAHGASRPYLMRTLELDAQAVLATASRLLGREISAAGLAADPPFTPCRSLVNAEAL